MHREQKETNASPPTVDLAILSYLITIIFLISQTTRAHAQSRTKYSAEVSATDPSDHLYHVRIIYKTAGEKALKFNMSAWTPGFYEIADFGNAVSGFKAMDSAGNVLRWNKAGKNSWQVEQKRASRIVIDYNVKADNPFIANANLDKDYGYFIPGALIMYPDGKLQQPLVLKIVPFKEWPQKIAIAAHMLPGYKNSFYFNNFDSLFDTPVLMGKIDRLPAAEVYGRKIDFFTHQFRVRDPEQFMINIGRIAKSATDIIGSVPFAHYDFLAVGLPIHAFGGIEHFNSASLIMSNDTAFLAQPKTKIGMYGLLAHEYFHLYNVKRIKPIELGPFDYSKENCTTMLWVSEGFTDYYQYLILRRAGIINKTEVLEAYQHGIKAFEGSPGRLYQTLEASSLGIWEQKGVPQKRSAEEAQKTISVYDKGSIVGMLLDLKIRHETGNKRSLDDVMRALYQVYYLKKKRGFTDKEFRQTCEDIAGTSLTDLFKYVTTVTPIDYPKYLEYAGITIDTVQKIQPDLDFGADLEYHNTDSTYRVAKIFPDSSSDNATLKVDDKVIMVNGERIDSAVYRHLLKDRSPGDHLTFTVKRNNENIQVTVTLKRRFTRSIKMKKVKEPSALQTQIYNSWLRGPS